MKKRYKQILIGVLGGFLNGLFGAGGGSLVVPAMEQFLGMDEKKSHATAIAVVFLLSVVSSVFYLKNGFFDTSVWMPVTLGGILGGVVGAKLLAKIPKSWLKMVFGGMIMLTAIKMIF